MGAVERKALARDLDLAAAAQGEEDLLLAVFGVVVLGVALVARWQVDDLHAEGLDPELGPGALEGAAVDRLHLVDLLDRVLTHPGSSRFRRPRLGRTAAFSHFVSPSALRRRGAVAGR